MKNVSSFQIGVFVTCAVGMILAVLIFSGKIPLGTKTATEVTGTVKIWGTLPYRAVSASLEPIRKVYKGVVISYAAKEPGMFQADFVDALASGTGPDLVIITPADIVQNQNKLLTIPFASLPEAVFRSTFIDQAALFLNSTGTLALPLFVDPMIMYYNKDMLTSLFVVQPPSTWDDIVELNKKNTQKDDGGKLSIETVAMGTFDNITNAKDIIALLVLQSGGKIVDYSTPLKKYVSVITKVTQGVSPIRSALSFYISFMNPGDVDHYSWGSALPRDKDQFIAGKLATYFGYASELAGIRLKNPNLNFDIAMMPQRAKSTLKVTYGKIHGVAVVKSSKNSTLAVLMAQQLASQDAVKAYIAADPTFVPARKDLLSAAPKDNARMSLIYNSAIISQGWIDPDKVQTTALFQKTIGQLNAGSVTVDSIVTPLDSMITSILGKYQKED